MKKLLVIPNKNKDHGFIQTNEVLMRLSKKDCIVYLEDIYKNIVTSYSNIKFLGNNQLYESVELVIVLGGDGSILKVARRAAPLYLPIIGINLGRVGYMAEIEPNELDLLEMIFDENYIIENRMMLNIGIIKKNSVIKSPSLSLNDAVISNGSVSRMVEIELFCDSNLVNGYRADGLIVSTPTGSTAYSMSAGGPIIDPKMDCICVTPICSHSLTAKPLIFSSTSILEIKNVSPREYNLYLTIDGRENCKLECEDIVRVEKSNLTTKLMRMKEGGFYDILHRKMSDLL